MMIASAVGIIKLPLHLTQLCHTELHHGSALAGALNACILSGHTTYLLRRFSFDVFFAAVEKYRVDFIAIQPWIITHMVKERSLTSNYDLSSVKMAISSGSTSSKELCSAFLEIFKFPILNTFGMTEVIGAFLGSPDSSLKGIIYELPPPLFF